MTRVEYLVLALLCSGASLWAGAQQSGTDVSFVLKASLAAQTGQTTIQTVQLNGTVESISGSDDETVPCAFEAISSGSSRMEIDLGTGKRTEIRQTNSSGAVGAWSNGDGGQHAMAGHNVMTDGAWWFPALITRRFLSDPNAIVSFVGLENGLAHFRSMPVVPSGLPGAAADQIRHLGQLDLYLDSATLLPTQISFNVHPDNNALVDIPVLIKYSSYQLVSGANMPMRVQKYINETLALDVAIQNAAFNVNIPSTDFSAQ